MRRNILINCDNFVKALEAQLKFNYLPRGDESKWKENSLEKLSFTIYTYHSHRIYSENFSQIETPLPVLDENCGHFSFSRISGERKNNNNNTNNYKNKKKEGKCENLCYLF